MTEDDDTGLVQGFGEEAPELGGDGADTLKGDDAGNVLHGRRGNDYLIGQGGSDTQGATPSTELIKRRSSVHSSVSNIWASTT